MGVIDMPRKIRLVADCVLPKSSLPERVFASPITLTGTVVRSDETGEEALESSQPSRKICVIRW